MVTLLKNMIVAALGAAVSYYVSEYTKKLLAEKPLDQRVDEAKIAAGDKLDTLIGKLDQLIEAKKTA